MTTIERFLTYDKKKQKDLFYTTFVLALKEATDEKSALKLRQITEHFISVREWETPDGKNELTLHRTDREDKPISSGISTGNSKTKRKNNSKLSGGIQNKSTK